MADGNLIFDTKIDQSGFVKGIKSIGKGVTDFAADIKNLVNRAISSFKQITAAYQTQIEAEARLGATMRNSTSATKEQIQSVKDLASALQETGVVGDEVQLAGAQELATYVGSVDSIKKMLPVLNDMIAQQYGFNATTDSAVTIATMLGKVLQGQTSALSRYGYKFTEAQEQLLKFGTEEQKVATLAEVVEESVSGVNKALADTPTGKVKQLSNDFGDLKETLGKFLTEIAYPIVVQLDVIVKKLNEVFTEASKGIKELFGIADDVSIGGMSDSTAELDDTSADTADNFADIAESAKEAEKANKGSLAAFDELNVLTQEMNETTESDFEKNALNVLPGGIGTGITLDIDADTAKAESKTATLIDRIKTSVGDFFAPLKQAWEKLNFEPLKSSFDRLKKSLEPLIDNIGAGLSWFLDEVLIPLGSWTIEEAIPAALTVISGAIDLISAVGEKAGQYLKSLWDDFLSPAASWLGDTIVSFLENLGQFLTDVANNETAVTILTNVGIAILAIAACIEAVNIALEAKGVIMGILGGGTISTLGWILIALGAILAVVIEIFVYQDTLSELWENGKELWSYYFATMKEAWFDGVETWKRYLSKAKDWFCNGWEQFANWWTDKVTGLLDKVKDYFKRFANKLIGFDNGILSGTASGINRIIELINNLNWDIPDWVPIIGGNTWGFNISPITPPQIPYLATGTVIPANYGEFAAILGDNKRDPEIVSPIPAMKQAFLEALAESGLIGGSSGDIVIEIDGREVFRAVKKENDTQKRRHGGVSLLA